MNLFPVSLEDLLALAQSIAPRHTFAQTTVRGGSSTVPPDKGFKITKIYDDGSWEGELVGKDQQ